MADSELDDNVVRVRIATELDMPLIHSLIHELAVYEGVPDGPRLSVEDLVEDGFRQSPAWFFALVAERGAGGPLGYALCHRAYSSWTRRAFYVEDLYVRAAHRRAGVGSRLMAHLAQMAVAEGVQSMDWHVLESNVSARAFYSRLGARDLRLSEGRAALRLDAPFLARLARPAGPASPASPTGPASPAGPTGPVSPAGPASPTGPTSPASPAGPAGPASPAGSASLAGFVGPAGPVNPADMHAADHSENQSTQ